MKEIPHSTIRQSRLTSTGIRTALSFPIKFVRPARTRPEKKKGKLIIEMSKDFPPSNLISQIQEKRR